MWNNLFGEQMYRAMGWSCGIGASFFVHRYYRVRNVKNAFRTGSATMLLSFGFIWAQLITIWLRFAICDVNNAITMVSQHNHSQMSRELATMTSALRASVIVANSRDLCQTTYTTHPGSNP